jgi:hypothetical protein
MCGIQRLKALSCFSRIAWMGAQYCLGGIIVSADVKYLRGANEERGRIDICRGVSKLSQENEIPMREKNIYK